jgi:hypothetical protein
LRRRDCGTLAPPPSKKINFSSAHETHLRRVCNRQHVSVCFFFFFGASKIFSDRGNRAPTKEEEEEGGLHPRLALDLKSKAGSLDYFCFICCQIPSHYFIRAGDHPAAPHPIRRHPSLPSFLPLHSCRFCDFSLMTVRTAFYHEGVRLYFFLAHVSFAVTPLPGVATEPAHDVALVAQPKMMMTRGREGGGLRVAL